MNNKRKGTSTIFFILLLAVFFMTACESIPEESQESEDSSSKEAVEGETEEGDTVEESLSKSPSHISFSRDGKLAFVTNVVSNDVSVLDVEKKEIVDTIPVGRVPNEGKPSADGSMLYVASLLDDIAVVDMETYEVIKKIDVGSRPHEIGFLPKLKP